MDAEVEALYGLPLDEFTKARDALAKARAREQGKGAAAEVKALRKPSMIAWALNQLARRHPAAIDALTDAGARLRRAQTAALEGGDPDELRQATRAEAGAVHALAGQARSILSEAGRGGSAAQEERLAATLRAAAVDEGAADLLKRGVLTEELSPAGFGFGVGQGELAEEAFSTPPAERREQERRRQEEQEAERRELRDREKELEAARGTADRLLQAADEADHRAAEAREKAIDAAGRAERLANDVNRLKEKQPQE